MIVYGSEIALKIKTQVKAEIDEIKLANKRIPKLGVILVGDNPASISYIKGKGKACEEVGMDFELMSLAADVGQATLIEKIEMWNQDPSIDGILVQLPLPKGYDYDEKYILEMVKPSKDVDGLTSFNAGKLFLGEECFAPCTPLGVMEILKYCQIDLCGKNVVVVGRSNLVGLPLSRLLIGANATVTVCHSKTNNLKEVCQRADVLIVTIGKARYINHEYVKDGAVVIDVGVNRVDGKLYGDVDFDSVKDKASIITPVPKGVGPMTIAMLIVNVLKAYRQGE